MSLLYPKSYWKVNLLGKKRGIYRCFDAAHWQILGSRQSLG